MKTGKIIVIGMLLMIGSLVASAGSPNTKTVNPVSNVLKGEITDKYSKERLAGVIISLDGVDEKLYSDADGNFTVSGLKPGEYMANFKLISYKEQKVNILVTGSENNKIKVRLESVQP